MYALIIFRRMSGTAALWSWPSQPFYARGNHPIYWVEAPVDHCSIMTKAKQSSSRWATKLHTRKGRVGKSEEGWLSVERHPNDAAISNMQILIIFCPTLQQGVISDSQT